MPEIFSVAKPTPADESSQIPIALGDGEIGSSDDGMPPPSVWGAMWCRHRFWIIHSNVLLARLGYISQEREPIVCNQHMLRFIISTDDMFIGDEKKRLQDYQIPLLLPWLLLTQGLSNHRLCHHFSSPIKNNSCSGSDAIAMSTAKSFMSYSGSKPKDWWMRERLTTC